MPAALPPLSSLRVFEAAARHLSFKQAAGELHVTPTAVSHQIRALENYLGTALFHRLTRALELTEAGAAMLPSVQQGLACLANAVSQARQVAATRRLTAVVPPSFATRWLVHRLQGFNALHPEIDLALSTALSTVDSTDNRTREADLARLVSGEVDLQIRFGQGGYPGMRCDLVCPVNYVAICHPALLAGRHPLEHPADLRHHTLIHDDTYRDRSEPASWHLWLRTLGVKGIDTSRGPRFSNSGLALDAAMDGMGIAISIAQLLDRDIEAGRLTTLFGRGVRSHSAYYLVVPENRADLPEIARFRRWLLDESAGLRD